MKDVSMNLKKRSAFTMVELIFVIVVIGILSAVAIPKLAANRDDAVVSKAKTTVAAVRSSLATERQKRILRGNFVAIFGLSSNQVNGDPIFDAFDGNVSNPALEYPPSSCTTAGLDGCWEVTTLGAVGTDAVYTFNMPLTGTVDFTLSNNRFNCPVTAVTAAKIRDCKRLTQ